MVYESYNVLYVLKGSVVMNILLSGIALIANFLL